MSNADSDMKSFLAFTDCADAHPVEDLTVLVPLVQTGQADLLPVLTRPMNKSGD